MTIKEISAFRKITAIIDLTDMSCYWIVFNFTIIKNLGRRMDCSISLSSPYKSKQDFCKHLVVFDFYASFDIRNATYLD